MQLSQAQATPQVPETLNRGNTVISPKYNLPTSSIDEIRPQIVSNFFKRGNNSSINYLPFS